MNDREETRKLEQLTKVLGLLVIILIIVDLMSCAREAKAATITGEKPLAGISYLRQQIIDKGLTLPEVEDARLLAEVMYHENWNTDKERKAAYYTGAVVLNRVKHKGFPNTVKGVLYQVKPVQYVTTGKFFSEELPAECYALAIRLIKYGAPEVPAAVIYQSTHEEFGSGVWREINGEYFNYE